MPTPRTYSAPGHASPPGPFVTFAGYLRSQRTRPDTVGRVARDYIDDGFRLGPRALRQRMAYHNAHPAAVAALDVIIAEWHAQRPARPGDAL